MMIGHLDKVEKTSEYTVNEEGEFQGMHMSGILWC